MADPELNWDSGARGIDIVLAQVKEGGGQDNFCPLRSYMYIYI